MIISLHNSSQLVSGKYPLYVKIGFQHDNTYTSTYLKLVVYKDNQCSREYSADNRTKGSNGYGIHGYYLSSKVSFWLTFYSCQGCNPELVPDTFTKQYMVM